ncbi:MAG: hypothetical protein Q7K45_01460 [Nanoarchaeota archaeon]|nr:hypothetical protein [Nanoarchaeota archaeon]
MGRILEKELAEAGYKLFGASEKKEKLILDILKTKDARYLKAIPFLIYQYNLDLDKMYQKTTQKEILGQIIEFTRKIFKENNITMFLSNISGQANLNYEEFKQEFELQQFNAKKPEMMIEKQKVYAERDLQMWLSQLFTKKEKEIMRRILDEKPVSKTDYEYYSRKTKKKLKGIINLQEFARTLSFKSPKYDEDLFRLKKLLEEWLGKTEKYKEVMIQRFSILDRDKIFIYFEQKKEPSLLGQGFNTTKRLTEIKNKEILMLLEKYKDKEQDFN